MIDDATRAAAQRLIGQHPAALRSVCWGAEGHLQQLHHLEIETKHGRVLVFDHRQARVYCNPPRPREDAPHNWVEARSWQDLTERAPAAFDGRPVITDVSFDESRLRWQFRFSTSAELSFVLDATNPLLLSS